MNTIIPSHNTSQPENQYFPTNTDSDELIQKVNYDDYFAQFHDPLRASGDGDQGAE